MLRPSGDRLEWTALANGKPLADATFIAIGSDLKDHKSRTHRGKPPGSPILPGDTPST